MSADFKKGERVRVPLSSVQNLEALEIDKRVIKKWKRRHKVGGIVMSILPTGYVIVDFAEREGVTVSFHPEKLERMS